mgnify:CR=1 FL=1
MLPASQAYDSYGMCHTYIYISITSSDPLMAARAQDLESVLFAGPNNRGPTLEAYYAECSRGK